MRRQRLLTDAHQAYVDKVSQHTGQPCWLTADAQRTITRLVERLRGEGIDGRDYIEASYDVWLPWCTERGMAVVPVQVLCSEPAVNRFRELRPIEDNRYLTARLVMLEIELCGYGIGQLLTGAQPGEVEREMDSMVEAMPDWYLAHRRSGSALYRSAEKTAIQHCARLFRVPYRENDGYVNVAVRAMRRNHV